MRSARRLFGFTIASMFATTLLGACNRMGSPAAAQVDPLAHLGVPVGQPGKEVDGAKEVLRQLAEQKSMGGMAPYLSNRSAAAMGTIVMIPLAMMSAFADIGEQMSKELGKMAAASGAKPSVDPAQEQKLKELKNVEKEIDAITAKYDAGKKSGPNRVAKLEASGRAFLHDMGALLDRFAKSEAGKEQDLSFKTNDFTKMTKEVDFQVVSSTEVKLIPKNKKDRPSRVVVEDGKWRLDFGGLEQLGDMMGASKKPMTKSGSGWKTQAK